MDISILGLLNDIAGQNSINSLTGEVSSLSFPQVFSDAMGLGQISTTDLLSALFPANNVNVKVGNCNVTDQIWQRADFPSWRYFQDNVSADSLNSWRAAGAEPTDMETYIQRELKKVGFGEMAVILPDGLQKKMEADSAYAQEITEKLKKWKTDYDDMDNVLAASYGKDPVLHQKTKSYCVRLDEEGNVKNYMVVSGGMDTEQSDDANKVNDRVTQRTTIKTVDRRSIPRRYRSR